MVASLVSIFGWHLRPFRSSPSSSELDRNAQAWAIQHGFEATVREAGILELRRGSQTLEVTSVLLNVAPQSIDYIRQCFDRAEEGKHDE